MSTFFASPHCIPKGYLKMGDHHPPKITLFDDDFPAMDELGTPAGANQNLQHPKAFAKPCQTMPNLIHW